MTQPVQRYHLAHQSSALGVAYFSPEPYPAMELQALLAQVRALPMDEFLRGYARGILGRQDLQTLRTLFADDIPTVRSLILETALLTPTLSALWLELAPHTPELRAHTPQIFLASAALPDHETHRTWSQSLRRNIFEHVPLADLQPDALPPLAIPTTTMIANDPAAIAAGLPGRPPCPRRPVAETYQIALERLYGLGVFEGPEMRHEASLSPWGLLRRWRLDRTIRCGALAYRIEGTQTSYGRGLSLADARASLAMEIVERYSSFADIRDMRISGSSSELILATPDELRAQSKPFLDPNAMRLEIPYTGQPLHWIEGQDLHGQSCFIPVQAVYLFTNLDEVQLFSGIGSTGLASGNTPEEAKVSGLLEVVERDSEAVTLFDYTRCFRVRTDQPELAALLAQYEHQGIDLMFQDMTTELGIPCYKCFVLTSDGLVKATGASLSGLRAAISAMTETPFPFPGKARSKSGPELPVRRLEDLPDYSTGSAQADLQLLEALLTSQGFTPYYVDLTKREMRLPVFRSVVPGLEIVSDFDRFTRISPRLWRDVLRMKREV